MKTHHGPEFISPEARLMALLIIILMLLFIAMLVPRRTHSRLSQLPLPPPVTVQADNGSRGQIT